MPTAAEAPVHWSMPADSVSTLTPMSPEEAETFGIPEEDRRLYVGVDRAKVEHHQSRRRGQMVPPSRRTARECN